jgi:hypothetical protein
MANVTSGIKTAAIASLPLDGIETIVDLGGADGAELAAILPAHPHMRGVLFDLPHVIADAPKALADRGIEDRVDCVAGDLFASVPAGGDGYLLSLVLHDWPDPQALRNIAAAGGSGARLLIIELVVPAGDTPHLAKMIDLTMLAMAGGKERTEPEWRELLTAVGFTGIAVRQTGTPTQSATPQPHDHEPAPRARHHHAGAGRRGRNTAQRPGPAQALPGRIEPSTRDSMAHAERLRQRPGADSAAGA